MLFPEPTLKCVNEFNLTFIHLKRRKITKTSHSICYCRRRYRRRRRWKNSISAEKFTFRWAHQVALSSYRHFHSLHTTQNMLRWVSNFTDVFKCIYQSFIDGSIDEWDNKKNRSIPFNTHLSICKGFKWSGLMCCHNFFCYVLLFQPIQADFRANLIFTPWGKFFRGKIIKFWDMEFGVSSS